VRLVEGASCACDGDGLAEFSAGFSAAELEQPASPRAATRLSAAMARLGLITVIGVPFRSAGDIAGYANASI
jgi:hypothetical protein